jgi:hypothetical protein
MECEFGNIVVSKNSPHSCEQVQDQLVGDENIRQTSNESSNSSNFLSHSPFYDEPNCLLETILYSLKEHTIEVDQFIQGQGMKPQFEKHILIISRDAFRLLDSSTYYSLYHDIFYHQVMQPCVPHHLGMNYALYN